MVFKLHSRLVIFNVCAIVLVTLFMGYYLSENLRSTLESEIEDQLYASASLAKSFIHISPRPGDSIAMARDIGKTLNVRVTLIDKAGNVLGDSDLTPEGVASVENHRDRPEVMAAMESGRGTSIRS